MHLSAASNLEDNHDAGQQSSLQQRSRVSRAIRTRRRPTSSLHAAAALGDEVALLRLIGRPRLIDELGSRPRFAVDLSLGLDLDAVALDTCACQRSEDDCVCLGYAPLHCAAQAGSASTTEVLLAAGADKDVRSGRLLFGLRAVPSHMLLGTGNALAERLTVTEPALSVTAVEGLTPLHVAVACGHLDVVEILLQHHADPSACANEPRQNALAFASGMRNKQMKDVLRRAQMDRLTDAAKTSESQHLSQQRVFLAKQDIGFGSEAMMSASVRLEAMRQRIRAREAREGERIANAT